MATQVQLRRGTATENNSFTGAQGELTFDTTNKRVRIHDGATAGGFELKTENSSGDTLFADNEKAIFGAGSDLQIYHDSASGQSIIHENGPSVLKIRATDFRISNADNTADYLSANNGAEVSIRYNGAVKLATTSTGIDVTGTVTADSLTVDGVARLQGGAPYLYLDNSSNTGSSRIYFGDADSDITGYFLYDHSTNSLRTGVNGSERMRIDSSGNVGIGTSSPNAELHIEKSSADAAVRLVRTGYGYTELIGSTGGSGNDFKINLNGTDRFYIQNSSGNVGIGTSSPTFTAAYGGLHVHSTYPEIHLTGTDSGSGAGDGFKIQKNSANHVYLWNYENAFMALGTNNTERMRIDASGNLLVGKTSLDGGATTGVEFKSTGEIAIARSSGSNGPLYINRISNDGNIITLAKDGTTVGSIGTINGDAYIITGNTGLRFYDAGNSVFPVNTNGASRDNAVDLGFSTVRFKDLYLSGGIYLGGVGAANKLDDYEEGYHQTSFTPSGSGSITLSGAHRYLRYTKIGNHVYISGKVDVSSVSSPVGYIHVSLPFAIDNTSPAGANDSRRFAGTVWVTNASINMTEFTLYGIEGESSVRIYRSDTTINASTSAQTFSGNEGVAFNFFYATTA